ncbi:MAG: hypothetical protein KC910_22285, partial [Candidatus Eremiobacteraeota bacterium]|nr:hypothetical protein [Candidatus Eremiobacteraeota bacterium]
MAQKKNKPNPPQRKRPPPPTENPAAFLALACERALAQQIYAVEFAVHFSHVERHYLARRPFLAGYSADPSLARRAAELWDRLGHGLELIRAFAEAADLAALDRGLGICRGLVFEFDELFARARLVPAGELEAQLRLPALEREWQQQWQARVARQHGQTRAEFHCKKCGWEFAYT